MLELLKQEANRTYTENAARTYRSTRSDCLDLFATIGALRRESDAEIIARFERAWAENADLAIKTLFFARDVRGGLGERRIFRVLLKHIGNTYTASARRNIAYIAEYGKGQDILERVKYCTSFNEVANTNLQSVFELILRAAVKHALPQSELPQTLYIISDMEFDGCLHNADATNIEQARELFAQHGFRLPRVVFWNVASRNRQQPVTMSEQGMTLVSGASPRVFSMVQSGNLSPMAFMLDALGAERYARIQA